MIKTNEIPTLANVMRNALLWLQVMLSAAWEFFGLGCRAALLHLESACALWALLRRHGGALAAEPALHGRLQHALLPRQPPAQQQVLRKQLLRSPSSSNEL